MNSKDLLRAFGDIDEKYLDEEHETPKEKNKKEFYIKIIRNKKNYLWLIIGLCGIYIRCWNIGCTEEVE